jgi:hypothetical protein
MCTFNPCNYRRISYCDQHGRKHVDIVDITTNVDIRHKNLN